MRARCLAGRRRGRPEVLAYGQGCRNGGQRAGLPFLSPSLSTAAQSPSTGWRKEGSPPASGPGPSPGVVLPSHTEHGRPRLPMAPPPWGHPTRLQPCPGRVVSLLWAGEALPWAKRVLRLPGPWSPSAPQPPPGGSAGLGGAAGPSLPGCRPRCSHRFPWPSGHRLRGSLLPGERENHHLLGACCMPGASCTTIYWVPVVCQLLPASRAFDLTPAL